MNARARTTLRRRVVAAALAFPGAHEDFPWGEQVAKVEKKIFAFLGTEHSATPGMAVKLPDSHDVALSLPGVSPCGYGLARSGWVRVEFDHPDCPGVDLLLDWLDESYRAVAPKRLVLELDRVKRGRDTAGSPH